MQKLRENKKYLRALKAAFPHTIPIFALSIISGRKANTEIYPISWKCLASGCIRFVGRLLPQEYKPVHWQSWYAGINCDCGSHCAALLETSNASVHCWWHHMLYVFGTVCFLGRFHVRIYWIRHSV